MDSVQDLYPSATVLVVDDTPDNLMLIAELLKDNIGSRQPTAARKHCVFCKAIRFPTDPAGHHDARPARVIRCEQLKGDHRTRQHSDHFPDSMVATEYEIRG